MLALIAVKLRKQRVGMAHCLEFKRIAGWIAQEETPLLTPLPDKTDFRREQKIHRARFEPVNKRAPYRPVKHQPEMRHRYRRTVYLP